MKSKKKLLISAILFLSGLELLAIDNNSFNECIQIHRDLGQNKLEAANTCVLIGTLDQKFNIFKKPHFPKCVEIHRKAGNTTREASESCVNPSALQKSEDPNFLPCLEIHRNAGLTLYRASQFCALGGLEAMKLPNYPRCIDVYKKTGKTVWNAAIKCADSPPLNVEINQNYIHCLFVFRKIGMEIHESEDYCINDWVEEAALAPSFDECLKKSNKEKEKIKACARKKGFEETEPKFSNLFIKKINDTHIPKENAPLKYKKKAPANTKGH